MLFGPHIALCVTELLFAQYRCGVALVFLFVPVMLFVLLLWKAHGYRCCRKTAENCFAAINIIQHELAV